MMKSMLKPIIAIAAAALILVGSGAALSKTAAANAEKELNEMLIKNAQNTVEVSKTTAKLLLPHSQTVIKPLSFL